MKIAIIHNFMDNIGGAEIVTLTLARELDADIITTNVDCQKIKKMGFGMVRIRSIGKIPINAPFRQQIAFWKLRGLKLKGYDFFIIAGDWAISAAVNNKPNLEYFHSPLNELWEFNEHIRNNWLSSWKRPIFDVWTMYNRFLYKRYFNHVQKKVCNSENTRGRIRKYLNSEAKIVCPPIETKRFKFREQGDYWLSVNRLSRNKRVEMQLKAFSRLPDEKLIIVGSYEKSSLFLEYVSYLKKIKPKNVQILNWVEPDNLIELYSNCKGFIATARDEDFGMTVVEAMASGKPVVAGNEGGYKETVINRKTGILIDNINAEKLARAITDIGDTKKYKAACLQQAKKFGTKNFIEKIKKEIKK
jgi:glycosyltransferase involved in cell wall biosynthesis